MAEIVNISDEKKELIEIAKELSEKKEMLMDERVSVKVDEVSKMLKNQFNLEIPKETIVQIGALFALPDDKFEVISEQYLITLEEGLANTSDKIALCQVMNLSNLKAEDLQETTEVWNQQIDAIFGTQFSIKKTNFLKRIYGILVNAAMESEGISKRIITIPIEINEGGKAPKYANPGDAGADVCALEETVIGPGETKLIKTGLKVAIPKGYEIQVRPRSGLSLNSKLRIANTPGTIDSGYRDEICIICENTDPKIKDLQFEYAEDGTAIVKSIAFGSSIIIEKGQRIAQLVLSEVPTMNFVRVDSIPNENDRGGGFGSTGA